MPVWFCRDGGGGQVARPMVKGLRPFLKLTAVCLKMLFRKSTRKRFVCLVLSFLFMVGLNTFFFLQRHHEVEIEKRGLLDEKAFKVFFLRARTRHDVYRLVHRSGRELAQLGGAIVENAFIYQNNLFMHFNSGHVPRHQAEAMVLMEALFGAGGFSQSLFEKTQGAPYLGRIRNAYLDHNGAELAPKIVQERHDEIKRDLYDLADMIRGSLTGRRMTVYNDSVRVVVETLSRVRPVMAASPNPYLSRVEAVIPANLIYIFSHLQDDVTTDIEDLAQAIRVADGGIETFKEFLEMPESTAGAVLYADINAYPRYIPVFVPKLLTEAWHPMMYYNLRLNQGFMAFVEARHFKGNLLFSYEKTQILQSRTQRINSDLRSNQINFYFTDLTMGIAFPFMISLFAFIHLKTELAFLLMFKNRIRLLLMIFWMLPMALVLAAKGALTAGYMIHAQTTGVAMEGIIVLPLLLSFAVAAIIFYPVNRWCFSSFTGDNLCLYELHKGR
ncbi:MAG: hypothetical protein JEZ11_22240 [Desulfobacterales bacterium]|nr:hypothetical protein [Desulfobacterales bacterium]